ncbi:MAG: hypothetical protein H7A53_02165 [Akkermansiaceae bacterium]|nr:hypothetical protein [Akkermansiaceae bacterium]
MKTGKLGIHHRLAKGAAVGPGDADGGVARLRQGEGSRDIPVKVSRTIVGVDVVVDGLPTRAKELQRATAVLNSSLLEAVCEEASDEAAAGEVEREAADATRGPAFQ